jgi:hypothetical protein
MVLLRAADGGNFASFGNLLGARNPDIFTIHLGLVGS